MTQLSSSWSFVQGFLDDTIVGSHPSAGCYRAALTLSIHLRLYTIHIAWIRLRRHTKMHYIQCFFVTTAKDINSISNTFWHQETQIDLFLSFFFVSSLDCNKILCIYVHVDDMFFCTVSSKNLILRDVISRYVKAQLLIVCFKTRTANLLLRHVLFSYLFMMTLFIQLNRYTGLSLNSMYPFIKKMSMKFSSSSTKWKKVMNMIFRPFFLVF